MATALAALLVGCPILPASQPLDSPPSRSAAPSLAALVSPSPWKTPAPSPTPLTLPPLTSQGLQESVSASTILAHLAELQRIAQENGGNRAAGSPGFDASLEYVASRLEAAGYLVERLPFSTGSVTGVNLIAELPGTANGEVVMLGAHLDSVPEGPGINDNGSGSMTVLEIAERLAAFEPPARGIRLAFWAAEEPGLYGSSAYVAALRAGPGERVVAYLNLDIIGSPNFIRFVYADELGAPGSEAITRLLGDDFATAGLPWEPIDLSGKSDHAPFATAGIPTGGLFSGGREPKTDAQAATYGGTPGAPADGCADHACDTLENVNLTVLEQMADAVADALVTLAGS